MKSFIYLSLLLVSVTHADTQKVLEALKSKKVIDNEKFLIIGESKNKLNAFYVIYGQYDYHGSKDAEYIIARYNGAQGLDILIRDQALHGIMDGKRKAAEIPSPVKPEILKAYGQHLTPTSKDYKNYMAYIDKKIAKKSANSDEKWLRANLKDPSKRK